MNNVNIDVLNKSRKAIKDNPKFGYKQWNTKVNWKNGLEFELETREFSKITSDIGAPLGGTDSAPTPIEYLLNAAGSCFATTFLMLASQQNHKIDNFSIDIETDFSASPFLGLSDEYAGIYNTVFKVTVDSDESAETISDTAEQALLISPVVDSLKIKPSLVIL